MVVRFCLARRWTGSDHGNGARARLRDLRYRASMYRSTLVVIRPGVQQFKRPIVYPMSVRFHAKLAGSNSNPPTLSAQVASHPPPRSQPPSPSIPPSLPPPHPTLPTTSPYGANRPGSLGNSAASLMLFNPRKYCTMRFMPNPPPPCGLQPHLNASV